VLVAFHKPYGVVSQFTRDLPRRSAAQAGGSPNRTLAEFGFPKNVYPIGRLDADSEGLLLLSDEPEWNERLLHPRHAHEREYWAQVERIPSLASLKKLERGVSIQSRETLPCRAWILEPQPEISSVAADVSRLHNSGSESGLTSALSPNQNEVGSALRARRGAIGTSRPTIYPRNPPIRFRKSVPDCWIGLELIEGKNRQVRRMTAAIGHPTLRLLRVRIGNFWLGNLSSGQWRILSAKETRLVLS
jgi:23S rRNA pseudouridine2457 synthase